MISRVPFFAVDLLGVMVKGCSYVIAIVAFFCASCTAMYQTYIWLRFGYWHPMPVAAYPDLLLLINIKAEGIAPPFVSWRGIEMIIEWLLDAPLSVVSILLSITCAGVGAYAQTVEDAAYDRHRAAR